MADDIRIHGGGSVTVTSSVLSELAHRTEHARNEAGLLALGLPAIDVIAPELLLRAAEAPLSAFEVTREIHLATTLLAEGAAEATIIGAGLRAAGSAYALAEHGAGTALNALAARFAHDLGGLIAVRILATGSVGGLVMLLGSPVGATAVGAVIAGWLTTGDPSRGFSELGSIAHGWLTKHTGLLTNRGTVELIRLVTGSMDDAMNGAVGVPSFVSDILGDQGLRITGVDTASAVILALTTPFGLFAERGVNVAEVEVDPPPLPIAPTTFEDRISRIPKTDSNGGAQIRVDRFSTPGEPDRFEVYLSGTQDFSPVGTTTPFDLGSNVRGVAGLPNGSLSAVEKALEKAGVTPSSPIVFTGHSQGGLLAHELAASGKYNTIGVLEAGPPASQSHVPKGVPEIILAHDTDLVTGLGGPYPGDDAIIVNRDPFAGTEIPTDAPVPAHDTGEYAKTAEILDRSSNHVTKAAREAMNSTGAGHPTVTTTFYKATRP